MPVYSGGEMYFTNPPGDKNININKNKNIKTIAAMSRILSKLLFRKLYAWCFNRAYHGVYMVSWRKYSPYTRKTKSEASAAEFEEWVALCSGNKNNVFRGCAYVACHGWPIYFRCVRTSFIPGTIRSFVNILRTWCIFLGTIFVSASTEQH